MLTSFSACICELCGSTVLLSCRELFSLQRLLKALNHRPLSQMLVHMRTSVGQFLLGGG